VETVIFSKVTVLRLYLLLSLYIFHRPGVVPEMECAMRRMSVNYGINPIWSLKTNIIFHIKAVLSQTKCWQVEKLKYSRSSKAKSSTTVLKQEDYGSFPASRGNTSVYADTTNLVIRISLPATLLTIVIVYMGSALALVNLYTLAIPCQSVRRSYGRPPHWSAHLTAESVSLLVACIGRSDATAKQSGLSFCLPPPQIA
jgi:hypothetical protein